MIAVVPAGGLLVLLALPAFHLHTAQSGLEALPKSAPTVDTIHRIEDAFSNGTAAPAIVAVRANTDSPATQQAITSPGASVASGQAKKPIDVEANASHDVARVTIPLVGNGVDKAPTPRFATLRNEILPATIGTSRARPSP